MWVSVHITIKLLNVTLNEAKYKPGQTTNSLKSLQIIDSNVGFTVISIQISLKKEVLKHERSLDIAREL